MSWWNGWGCWTMDAFGQYLVECATAEHAVGIVDRPGCFADLFAAMALEQTQQIRLDAARMRAALAIP